MVEEEGEREDSRAYGNGALASPSAGVHDGHIAQGGLSGEVYGEGGDGDEGSQWDMLSDRAHKHPTPHNISGSSQHTHTNTRGHSTGHEGLEPVDSALHDHDSRRGGTASALHSAGGTTTGRSGQTTRTLSTDPARSATGSGSLSSSLGESLHSGGGGVVNVGSALGDTGRDKENMAVTVHALTTATRTAVTGHGGSGGRGGGAGWESGDALAGGNPRAVLVPKDAAAVHVRCVWVWVWVWVRARACVCVCVCLCLCGWVGGWVGVHVCQQVLDDVTNAASCGCGRVCCVASSAPCVCSVDYAHVCVPECVRACVPVRACVRVCASG